MRGEHKVPEKYEETVTNHVAVSNGRFFREDLRYMYSLVVDAKDFNLIRKTAWQILKDGWKDSRTYKMLLFPLLGTGLTETGVKIKKALKR